MGLTKRARDEVDERIKSYFLAFHGGIAYTEEGVTRFEVVFEGFTEWIKKRYPELSEYVECEMCHKWYEEEA